MKQLTVAAAVLALVPSSFAQPAPWAPRVSQDPMTDRERTVMEARSAEDNGSLIVACSGDRFSMILLTDAIPVANQPVNFGKSFEVKGRWRIDGASAEGITFWAPRGNLRSLEPRAKTSSDSKRFLKKIDGRRHVVFQVEAIGGAATLSFELAGLDTSPLRCYSK